MVRGIDRARAIGPDLDDAASAEVDVYVRHRLLIHDLKRAYQLRRISGKQFTALMGQVKTGHADAALRIYRMLIATSSATDGRRPAG